MSKVRQSGKPFKQLVKEWLRLKSISRRDAAPHEPFKVQARALGVFPELNYDNIGELLEKAEGPSHW